MASDLLRILHLLHAEGVEFIVVGGMAMVSHGSAHVTLDLDICYRRSLENLERLARAIAPLHPVLRGAPAGLPFTLDTRALKAGLNFTLVTDAGDLDLLGELQGVGGYERLIADSETMAIEGEETRVMALDQLIAAKRAVGRPKDLIHLDELEEIRRRRSRAP